MVYLVAKYRGRIAENANTRSYDKCYTELEEIINKHYICLYHCIIIEYQP